MQLIKLSKREMSFLTELCNSKRPKFSDIARKLHMSKEMVTYTYKKLQEKKILKGMKPLLNYSCIGYSLYRAYVKLSPEVFAHEEDLLEYFKTVENIQSVVNTDGKYDNELNFLLKNAIEMSAIYNKILDVHGKDIFQFHLHILAKTIYKLPFKESNNISISMTEQTHTLDDIDIKILQLLTKTNWLTTIEISRILNISFNTVKNRIINLEEKGVIVGYYPIINYDILGKKSIKIMVDCLNNTYAQRISSKLREISSVTTITQAIGPYDIEFKCVVDSVNEAIEIINNLKKEFPIVQYDMNFTNKELYFNTIFSKT
ncbi:MAG: Lrp/AsnC family transcriptional regulator [Candidatus Woesearchaeota archaeon]